MDDGPQDRGPYPTAAHRMPCIFPYCHTDLLPLPAGENYEWNSGDEPCEGRCHCLIRTVGGAPNPTAYAGPMAPKRSLEASHVLKGMKLAKERARGESAFFIRFNPDADVEDPVEIVPRVINK